MSSSPSRVFVLICDLYDHQISIIIAEAAFQSKIQYQVFEKNKGLAPMWFLSYNHAERERK
jgi:hypothetical protein